MSDDEKTVLVTGAARGIGRAVAVRFLQDGWRVGLLDIDGDTLSATADDLAKEFGAARSMALEADVSDQGVVMDAVARFLPQGKRLDALVNNAGIANFKPLSDTSLAEWTEILSVNLTGPFIMSQACLPHFGMGSSIVNIGSISGLRASTLRVAYGTSKAALAHLTRQQAAELGERGIRVNLVAPGPVETAMAKAVHSKDIRAAYHDAIPLNRYGAEREIAAAICFLCGPEASYITGQTLAVDGGFDAVGIGLPSLRKDDQSS